MLEHLAGYILQRTASSFNLGILERIGPGGQAV